MNKIFFPLLDVSEINSHYTVELDVPGVKKEDININVDNNVLTIKGKKKRTKNRKIVITIPEKDFMATLEDL